MKKETVQALTELAIAAAKAHGWKDETPIEFSVCRPKRNCGICLKIYVVEFEFAPCPTCGAVYWESLVGEENIRLAAGIDFADPTGDKTVFGVTDGKTFHPIKDKE